MTEQRLTFDLPKGILVGGTRHTECEIRSLNGMEYLQCLAGSEKLVMVPSDDGNGGVNLDPEFVSSPAMMSTAVLKESISRIGPIEAPIPDDIWAKLDRNDINMMIQKSDEFESALLAVAQRGRSEAADNSAAQTD